jgi:predicted transposase YdaD
MSRADQLAYERHLDALAVQSDAFDTARMEGHAEGLVMGRAEGRAEGIAEGRAEGIAEGRAEGEQTKAIEIARRMKSQGISDSEISSLTGLNLEEVKVL